MRDEDTGRIVLEINMEIPLFDTGVEISEVFARSINSFYEKLLDNYLNYACRKVYPVAMAKLKNDASGRAYGEVMAFSVTFVRGYISVILDISHYDGVFTRQKRTSQVWDTKSGYLLPLKGIIRGNMSVGKIKKKLASQLEEQLKGECIHDYYAGCMRDFQRAFDKDSFFLTERGIVFYFQSGMLCPQNEGAVCFTLPWEAPDNRFSKG